MDVITLPAWLLGLVLLGTTPPPADFPTELQTAILAFDEAQVHGDRAALDRLIATDYLLVNSHGEEESKSQLIADYTTPGFQLDPFQIEQPVWRSWPNGAVAGGVATLTGMSDGKPFRVRLRFSDVWALREGRWQVVYTAASRVETP
jgi:hypothetical protein